MMPLTAITPLNVTGRFIRRLPLISFNPPLSLSMPPDTIRYHYRFAFAAADRQRLPALYFAALRL